MALYCLSVTVTRCNQLIRGKGYDRRGFSLPALLIWACGNQHTMARVSMNSRKQRPTETGLDAHSPFQVHSQ